MRAGGNHKHTTVPEHMPSSHRRYAGWTIDRIRQDARLIGPATTALCELILEQRPHPEQGFRACLVIVRLAGPYGPERLEAAAERAIDIGARTYGSVKSILNHLDRRPAHVRRRGVRRDGEVSLRCCPRSVHTPTAAHRHLMTTTPPRPQPLGPSKLDTIKPCESIVRRQCGPPGQRPGTVTRPGSNHSSATQTTHPLPCFNILDPRPTLAAGNQSP